MNQPIPPLHQLELPGFSSSPGSPDLTEVRRQWTHIRKNSSSTDANRWFLSQLVELDRQRVRIADLLQLTALHVTWLTRHLAAQSPQAGRNLHALADAMREAHVRRGANGNPYLLVGYQGLEPQFLKQFEQASNQERPDPSEISQALTDLAHFYEAVCKPEKALEFERQARNVRVQPRRDAHACIKTAPVTEGSPAELPLAG